MDPVDKLLGAFRRAKSALGNAVSRLFVRGKAKDASAAVDATIRSLNDESSEWVRDNLTRAAKEGVAKTIFDLREAKSLLEAAEKAKLNRANREMLAALISQTNADILAVTQNMDRRTKASIRSIAAEIMRSNLARGVNSSGSISDAVMLRLRTEANSALNTGIMDAAGRRWKPEAYVDMLVRTQLAAAQREATINEALGRGVLYGQISAHGATDACRNWEGRIVKLVPDAPGDYPYIGDLPRREIFHPRCRHVVSPIRNPK